MGSRRAKYTEEQKEAVRRRYPLARTLEEKRELAIELGMGEGAVHRLYNLASRLKATRTYDEWAQGPEQQEAPAARRYDAASDEERLRMREVPSETRFTREDDHYLKSYFGREAIEKIAFHRGHTEIAMLYRARILGLRRPALAWEQRKVMAWLGIEDSEWPVLQREGVEAFDLPDRRGHVRVTLVSATSLARWLTQGARWQRLVAGGADEFFCREILESTADVQRAEVGWERCRFLSAGHVCMNPWASSSLGLFCTTTDRHVAGEDPKCAVRSMRFEDLAAAERHDD